MRMGDCSENVYSACSTITATPAAAANRRSPRSLGGIPGDFDRLPRARFGAAVFGDIFRDTGRRPRIAGTLGQGRFVRIVELMPRAKDVVEAFFDQITTAALHADARSRATRPRRDITGVNLREQLTSWRLGNPSSP